MKVELFRISEVISSNGTTALIPEDVETAPFFVDEAFVARHNPQAGGFYVLHEDGYTSFSPRGGDYELLSKAEGMGEEELLAFLSEHIDRLPVERFPELASEHAIW